jgi:hypothetical protein
VKTSLVGDPEFIIKDEDSISSYLYEGHSKYSSIEAMKMFNCLDFVFLDGDSNCLPWLPRAEKFALLFKMCKATNKCFFSASIGMTLLVYYCATAMSDL